VPTSASTSLATQAGQKTNAHVSQLAGLADQYNMLCDGALTPLLCLLFFYLYCQLLLFPLLLHCELQLLRKLLKSRLPRRSEKRKALDAKSAGTQHRHPRGKSPHI
jgi:hypothetical protein